MLIYYCCRFNAASLLLPAQFFRSEDRTVRTHFFQSACSFGNTSVTCSETAAHSRFQTQLSFNISMLSRPFCNRFHHGSRTAGKNNRSRFVRRAVKFAKTACINSLEQINDVSVPIAYRIRIPVRNIFRNITLSKLFVSVSENRDSARIFSFGKRKNSTSVS